jgi:hypothetical protein
MDLPFYVEICQSPDGCWHLAVAGDVIDRTDAGVFPSRSAALVEARRFYSYLPLRTFPAQVVRRRVTLNSRSRIHGKDSPTMESVRP